MVKTQTILKHRIIMLFILALASVIFTGCEKGSLGIKSGAIQGYVIDNNTNQPISEVLVRATGTTGQNGTENKSTYTDGDGSFIIGDASKGSWVLSIEKTGYQIPEGYDQAQFQCTISNGETVVMSPFKLEKTASGTKGILKAYPIDSVTGRALTNFTVNQNTPYNERKTKTFDSAATFRDSGWTGLEGGAHEYIITANNYKPFSTSSIDAYKDGVIIGKSVTDLGTIKVEPEICAISGTIRNLPGYVLTGLKDSGLTVWAEAGGKIVATYTEFTDLTDDTKLLGNLNYQLNIPVTAGSVSIKCKLRGYDVVTISSAVSITTANPGGMKSGVDIDFSTIEPIKADVRIIFTGSEPEDTKSGSIAAGDVLRAYIQAGGVDLVPYAECIADSGLGGEVVITGVITGYEINILGVNRTRMYNNNGKDGGGLAITIPEGTDIYPVIVSFGD